MKMDVKPIRGGKSVGGARPIGRRAALRLPLLGAAAATFHNSISSMPDLTVSAASESGPRAFAQAGVKPDVGEMLGHAFYRPYAVIRVLDLHPDVH